LNNVILQDNIQDYWCWLIDHIHGYSVHGTYCFLTSQDEHQVGGANNDVWHKLVPAKVSLFAWHLFQDGIPTRSNLVRRKVLQHNDNLCVGGCDINETVDHLFIGCALFGSVWYLVCHWLEFSFVFPGSIKDHHFQFIHLAGSPRASHFYFKVIWLACAWVIWKDRNNCVFKNAAIDPHNIVEKVKLNSFLWLSSNCVPLAFDFHDWWINPLLCMGVM